MSELKLRRRVATLELAEQQALAATREVAERREELEEDVVRAKEKLQLQEHEAAARQAEMRSQIAKLRLEIQAAKEPPGKGAKQAAAQAAAATLQSAVGTEGAAGGGRGGGAAASSRQTGQGLVSTPPRSGTRPPMPGSSRPGSASRPGSSSRQVSIPGTPGGLGAAQSLSTPRSSSRRPEPSTPNLTGGAAGGEGGGGGLSAELEAVEARAELTEMRVQLSTREMQREELEVEVRELRTQLASVRSELAISEDALLRAESRYDLQLAQRPPAERAGSGSTPASPSRGSSAPGTPSRKEREFGSSLDVGTGRQVQQLLAERAEFDARHARKLSLAEESVKSMQSQLRRKDAEVAKLQGLLASARETNRRDKASAAASSEALAERLDARTDDFVTRGRAALERLTEDTEPIARGTDLTVRDIEIELERKELLISQLQAENAGVASELGTCREHLQQRIAEVETLKAENVAEKGKAPSHAMSQRVSQLTTSLRAKERELTKLREALSSLKEEMEIVAAEHTERMTRVVREAAANLPPLPPPLPPHSGGGWTHRGGKPRK